VRTIHADLLTAQNTTSNTPYIYLLFTSKDGLTTHDYSSDQAGRRILSIDHQEEPYNDYASIILRNNDRTIPNLKGYWTDIGYGYICAGDTARYSQTARLWVKHQQDISAQGKIVTLLELEGMWAKARELPMRRSGGKAPYYIEQFSTDTVYALMELVVETELGWALDALAEDDGIMSSYRPSFDVNTQPFESHGGILYRLISMTKSYLRTKASLTMEVKYPQTTDSVDITYYSNAAPYFYEYMERKNVLIPNHVYVFANLVDGLWVDGTSILAEAKDQTEIDAYGDTPKLVVAGTITNQTDADNRAAAVLTRAEAEVMAGRMYAPHDCQVELYDRLSVQDYRST